MSWKSAHDALNLLAQAHLMLHVGESADIDNGEWVHGRKIIVFYPHPDLAPREQSCDPRDRRNEFAEAVLALRLRPPFTKDDGTRSSIFPRSTRVAGFGEVISMSTWWLEVVSAASYSTALKSRRAWRADVAEWKARGR